MIRLMLVDDHDLVRTGIRRLLEDTNEFQVVAEATTGERALQLLRDTDPHVVLMDINMPGIGGLEATRKILIHKPEIKIIIISMHSEEIYPQRLLKAGASGYLTKGAQVDEIIHAIHEVLANRRYITPDVAQSLALSQFNEVKDSPFNNLSSRELQVLTLFMEGRKINEISSLLSLSPKTVSTYRHRIYEKLGVDSEIELTKMSIAYGIIENSSLK